eukprot:jgi/Chlat1/8723/Chrsp9S08577
MVYWLISVPVEGTRDNTWDSLQNKTVYERDLAQNHKFNIPELRVGTLDALLTLSDELQKVNGFVEGVTGKIKRQLEDLDRAGVSATEGSVVGGNAVHSQSSLTRFTWDEAKHPVKSSLRDLVDKIQEGVAKQEDELKIRTAEYGSLTVRDLSSLVTAEHIVETEHLTTLLVVVPRYSEREWLSSYEKLEQFVVPRSSKLIAEESDYALFTVVLFKKVVDSFKIAARDRSFQVREYEHNAEAASSKGEAAQRMKQEMELKQSNLVQWCQAAYGEVFSDWMHLLAIRIFTESILRYGLPPKFLAVVMKPNNKQEKRLRQILTNTYGKGGDSAFWSAEVSNEVSAFDGGAELFPYVSFTLNID